MSNRYNKTQKIINNSESYQELFDRKKINNITQLSSFNFGNLKNIFDSDVDRVLHIVQPGEKLYTISQKYYNNPDYGWLICYTNKISNELFVNIGTPLFIYFPLDTVLRMM